MVVAQLEERSLPTPEVCISNPVNSEFLKNIYCQLYWNDQNLEKEAGKVKFLIKKNGVEAIALSTIETDKHVATPTTFVY